MHGGGSGGARVSVQEVKSLDGHFACLCRGFDEVKKNIIIFQKGKGKLLIFFIVKSLQQEQIAEITYYEPHFAGINLQSPQTDSTPRRLTLVLRKAYHIRV